MKRFYVYIDASVIGGCEDSEFAEATLSLWQLFIQGVYIMVLSEHTLRELRGAPQSVRNRLLEIPEAHQIILSDTPEADIRLQTHPLGEPRRINRKLPENIPIEPFI